jgi:hypothetical protein
MFNYEGVFRGCGNAGQGIAAAGTDIWQTA